MQNITTYDECPMSCSITHYSGTITLSEYHGFNDASSISYKFAHPLFTKVFKQYIIDDFMTMIGAVGGTMGLFIGFSFHNMLVYIIKYLQLAFMNYFGISNNENDNRTSQNENLNQTIQHHQERFAMTEIQMVQMEQREQKLSIMERELTDVKQQLQLMLKNKSKDKSLNEYGLKARAAIKNSKVSGEMAICQRPKSSKMLKSKKFQKPKKNLNRTEGDPRGQTPKKLDHSWQHQTILGHLRPSRVTPGHPRPS